MKTYYDDNFGTWDGMDDGVGPIRTPIKDINGNRVGILEINL